MTKDFTLAHGYSHIKKVKYREIYRKTGKPQTVEAKITGYGENVLDKSIL